MTPFIQYYMMQRPTLVAFLRWGQVQITPTTLSVRFDAIAARHKTKHGNTIFLLRAVPGGRKTRLYPIPLRFAYPDL
jgi:hypothetical protein